MRTLLRVAAVLAFGFCFVAGLIILGLAFSTTHSDGPVIAAAGLLVAGVAFFVGGMLFVAAERLGAKPGGG
jgi:hypothetical protein